MDDGKETRTSSCPCPRRTRDVTEHRANGDAAFHLNDSDQCGTCRDSMVVIVGNEPASVAMHVRRH